MSHPANTWQDVLAFKRRGWITQADIDNAAQKRLKIDAADWKWLAYDAGSFKDSRNGHFHARNTSYEEARAAISKLHPPFNARPELFQHLIDVVQANKQNP